MSKTIVLISLLMLTACSENTGQEKKQAKDSKSTQAVTEEKAQKIVVYSSRKEHLIKPFFEEFTANTGIDIDYITDKAGPLVTRLKAEGARTPADIFMTVDAGNLWLAKREGVLQSVTSATLENNVAQNLQDPDNQWFGLTVRARTMVYDKNKVKPEELSSYEDLADPKWQGRLCLRTSKKVYNQSLVAMLIARHGEVKAESIIKGWVDNLATAPFSNDTKVVKAIEAGQCEVGIVNSYYFGRLEKENPDISVALYLPENSEQGVHVNISGAGITKHAKNPKAALQLIEWLSSKSAQQMYAGLNLEYPANTAVKSIEQVQAWGELNADTMNLSKAGELQPAAVQLMDRVGYK
ncbi:extracellular solute-binding protein [Kangiella sp. HZ709]|uniref:extracellular solute-binding protein n=1 Tax=Kangiella sp. HZ709 TaxID=2666328 RepID=UPI00351B6A52